VAAALDVSMEVVTRALATVVSMEVVTRALDVSMEVVTVVEGGCQAQC